MKTRSFLQVCAVILSSQVLRPKSFYLKHLCTSSIGSQPSNPLLQASAQSQATHSAMARSKQDAASSWQHSLIDKPWWWPMWQGKPVTHLFRAMRIDMDDMVHVPHRAHTLAPLGMAVVHGVGRPFCTARCPWQQHTPGTLWADKTVVRNSRSCASWTFGACTKRGS